MIDPTKFEEQGKPTRDQARTVWDSMPSPSSRTVAQELINRGFDISWRTVARWHANAWTEKTKVPVSEQVRTQVSKAKKEFAKLPGGPQPTLTLDEFAMIAQRRAELMLLPEAELDRQEVRARKIMNILIAEQAAQRAHVMVLMAKDTGSLVGALADAQSVGTSGTPAPGDPRLINGSAVHHAPDHPLANAIDKFFVDNEVA